MAINVKSHQNISASALNSPLSMTLGISVLGFYPITTSLNKGKAFGQKWLKIMKNFKRGKIHVCITLG